MSNLQGVNSILINAPKMANYLIIFDNVSTLSLGAEISQGVTEEPCPLLLLQGTLHRLTDNNDGNVDNDTGNDYFLDEPQPLLH